MSRDRGRVTAVLTISTLILTSVLLQSLYAAVNWSSDKRLTNHAKSDWSPSITQMSDEKIWVVWHSYRTGKADLFYKTYNGSSWSAAVQLTTNPSQDGNPSITQTKDNTIWVVWASNRTGNFEVFYKTSSDDGSSWSSDTQLTTHPANDMSPSIFQMKNGQIWVVWNSKRNGNDDIFYKTSANEGATWTSDTALTQDMNEDRAPSIMESKEGKIWVVWHSYRVGGSEIFYKTSSDGGLSWSSDTRLTKNPDFDLCPSVMQARDGNVWVVWDSDRNSVNGTPQSDIFYKIYDGAAWSSDTPLTADASDDIMPSLIHASNLTIWVVWTSDRNDNHDIYYKTCNDFSLIHDITMISVSASPTDVYPGRSVNVTVTLKNTGTVSETFNVTAYYDGTMIGTQTVTDLAPAHITNTSIITLNFTWGTLSVPPGYYVISATAEPVPSEAYVGDNSLDDGTIHIRILGDVNGNDAVDIFDSLVLVEHFGQPALAYPEADVDGDGFITIYDATYVSSNFGETFP